MGALRTIRRKVKRGLYELTRHAREEMRADELCLADIKRVILFGRLKGKLTGDPRGIRYVIRGNACDGREVEIICRILPVSGRVRVITVYVKEDET